MTPSTHPILAIWIGTIAALVAIMALALPAVTRAHRDAYSSRSMLTEVLRHADVIVSLRNSMPDAFSDDSSRGGLTPRVTAALEQAGLPSATLASLSPEAETQLPLQPGLRVSRRRATLTLSGVTLPQVGRFLDAWRASEPAWTPASIDLSPVGGNAPEAGGDFPLRAVIVIETAALGHDGAPR